MFIVKLDDAIAEVIEREGLESTEGQARYVIRSFNQQRLWLISAIAASTVIALCAAFWWRAIALSLVMLAVAVIGAVAYLRARGRAEVAREWLREAKPFLTESEEPGDESP